MFVKNDAKTSMLKRLALWIFCVALGSIDLTTFAKAPSYGLYKNDRGKIWADLAEQSTLRVYNLKTGRTIWKRRFREVSCVTWSSDHRALAFTTSPSIQNNNLNQIDQYRIVVWRAGEKIRFYTHQYITNDRVEFFVWPPDNSHILIGTSASGMNDEGYAIMYCLNLNTGLLKHVDSVATERLWHTSPKWHGNHEIVYRKLIFSPDKNGISSSAPILSKKIYRDYNR